MPDSHLLPGDCIELMKAAPPNSMDAVVCDPPYGLEFMGKKWDGWDTPKAFEEWCRLWAVECYRVLKPGGWLLAFGGTRTWHRLAAGIEDAGFEVRDSIAWLYGSGFPKSHSVHKATLLAVGSRYGSTRCGCLDARDGRPAGNGERRDGGSATGVIGSGGALPPSEAGSGDIQVQQGSDQRAMRELRQGNAEEAAGQAEVGEAVLLTDVRGRGAEEAGFGTVEVRAGLEEPASGNPDPRQGVPVVQQDARGERLGVARPSPSAVPVRGNESVVEPSGAVRLVSPHDRSDDRPSAGVDPDRREPRRIHSDGDGGRSAAVARVCSWCGFPDPAWLSSTEPLGTALKPAFEPIVVARKPFPGTVAANVLKYGTGALNIDASRVGTEVRLNPSAGNKPGGASLNMSVYGMPENVEGRTAEGRWPANVILSEDQADVLDGQSGERKSGGTVSGTEPSRTGDNGIYSPFGRVANKPFTDTGGASRFFYVAKAPKKERPVVEGVSHPTVKPLTLMRWLCTLVCQPGGWILDPFAGSGTTMEAALLEGFNVIGIENEPDYIPLINARIDRASNQEEK